MSDQMILLQEESSVETYVVTNIDLPTLDDFVVDEDHEVFTDFLSEDLRSRYDLFIYQPCSIFSILSNGELKYYLNSLVEHEDGIELVITGTSLDPDTGLIVSIGYIHIDEEPSELRFMYVTNAPTSMVELKPSSRIPGQMVLMPIMVS